MKRRIEKDGSHAVIVPWALFLGGVCAFIACCVAGRWCSERHHLTSVNRFHQLITPESFFYPTASQVKQLAMARTKKSCINVIIGGSSVLNGSGQQARELWSDKLAALLGPEYRVVNLGFRGALSGEFGALGAEMIMNRRRVIFITDVPPDGGITLAYAADGRMYRYFFWDAWYKKLIDQTIPLRREGVAVLSSAQKSDQKYFELRTGAQLDSACYYNDLWNTWTYTQGSVIWTRTCLSNSFKPRRLLADNEPKPPPKEVRHADASRRQDLERFLNRNAPPALAKDASGHWMVPFDKAEKIKRNIDTALPNEELRRRTIAIVTLYEPSSMASMRKEERDQSAALSSFTGNQIEAAGMRCIHVDGLFTDDDYADFVHLTASGGEKLAQKVAPAIRDLAASLGYKEQSGKGGKLGESRTVRP